MSGRERSASMELVYRVCREAREYHIEEIAIRLRSHIAPHFAIRALKRRGPVDDPEAAVYRGLRCLAQRMIYDLRRRHPTVVESMRVEGKDCYFRFNWDAESFKRYLASVTAKTKKEGSLECNH